MFSLSNRFFSLQVSHLGFTQQFRQVLCRDFPSEGLQHLQLVKLEDFITICQDKLLEFVKWVDATFPEEDGVWGPLMLTTSIQIGIYAAFCKFAGIL